MGTLSNSVRDLTIAAAALWNSATLPAAEPPAPAQQVGTREPAPAKEWSSAQVYKELGAVEARINSIDQFFKTHTDQRIEKSVWDTRRAEVERFSKDAEKQMEQTSSPELRRVLGSGLTAVNSSLALYLDHLSAKTTQTAPAASAPAAAPGGLPAPASGELIIGTYDVGDMAGMQTAAAMFRTLLEGQHARNGTAPDAMQQRILQGLSDIESARNPRDLSEKLRPAATGLIAGLADQNSPEAKALRESLQKLKSGNRATRGGFGGGNKEQQPVPPSPAGNEPQIPARKGGFGGGKSEQKSDRGPTATDAATAWEAAWKERVAGSTQLNRFAREVNCFRDLVQDPKGLTLVKESAEKLLKSVPNDQTLLREHLSTISKAASGEEILKSGFSALDELKKATDLYRGARTAR